MIVNPGENYEVVNTDDTEGTIYSDGQYNRIYNYNLYDASGQVISEGVNDSSTTLAVLDNGRLCIAVNEENNPVTFWGPYESFIYESASSLFPDPNLEAAVRETIGKSTGDILTSDLRNIVLLDASGKDISNLEGIQYLNNILNLMAIHC